MLWAKVPRFGFWNHRGWAMDVLSVSWYARQHPTDTIPFPGWCRWKDGLHTKAVSGTIWDQNGTSSSVCALSLVNRQHTNNYFKSILWRDLGGLELGDYSSQWDDTSLFSIMVAGIHARTGVWSVLSNQLPISLQPKATRCVWKVWAAFRPTVEIQIRSPWERRRGRDGQTGDDQGNSFPIYHT